MKEHPRGALRSIEEAQEALDRLGFLYAVVSIGAKVHRLYVDKSGHLSPYIWNLGAHSQQLFKDDYLFDNYWDAFAYLCKIKLALQTQTAV